MEAQPRAMPHRSFSNLPPLLRLGSSPRDKTYPGHICQRGKLHIDKLFTLPRQNQCCFGDNLVRLSSSLAILCLSVRSTSFTGCNISHLDRKNSCYMPIKPGMETSRGGGSPLPPEPPLMQETMQSTLSQDFTSGIKKVTESNLRDFNSRGRIQRPLRENVVFARRDRGYGKNTFGVKLNTKLY